VRRVKSRSLERVRFWKALSLWKQVIVVIAVLFAAIISITAVYNQAVGWSRENIGRTPFANRETEQVVAGWQFDRSAERLRRKKAAIRNFEKLKKLQGNKLGREQEEELRELRREKRDLEAIMEIIDKKNAPVVEHPQKKRR